MALQTSTSTSSASERARRLANRSAAALAPESVSITPAAAQPTLNAVAEVDATMTDAQDTTNAAAAPTAIAAPVAAIAAPVTAIAAPVAAPVAAVAAPVAAVAAPVAAAATPVTASYAAATAATGTPIYVRSESPTPVPDHGNFPPLARVATPIPTQSHAERRKAKGKGKGIAKAKATAHPSADETDDDIPDLTPLSDNEDDKVNKARTYLQRQADRAREEANSANMARGIAMSLGYRTDTDNGASSSRLPADPNSPPKRQRADSVGRAVSTGSDPDADETERNARPRRAPRPNPYLTIDGNPPQGSYAPTPRGGHRTVYGVTTDSLLFNHPARQRGQWDEVPHPKILATVAGGNGDRIATWEALRSHIAGRFNMNPEDVSVGTPGLGERPGPDPSAWLIAGLTVERAQELLNMGALVSDTMTTIFHQYHPQISGFAATFQGFTISVNNPDLAHAVIADAIMADHAVTRYVRAHRDAIPPFLTNDEALARFGESIHVTGIQLLSPRGLFTAWNVYVDSPTDSHENFAALARLIGNIVIDTPFNGQGRIYPRPLHCKFCGGRDHPTNLCPLPDTPGYLGPTPETLGALLEASREALHPKSKKTARTNNKSGGNGNGKGKDRDDRKGGNGRKGGRGE